MCEATPNDLYLACVFALLRQERHAARDETHGSDSVAARAIIMAGNPLSHVAIPSTPRLVLAGNGSVSQNHRRIVTIRKAVHHARCTLGPAIAGIADKASKGMAPWRLNSCAAAWASRPTSQ